MTAFELSSVDEVEVVFEVVAPSYELFPGSLDSEVFFELPLSGVEVEVVVEIFAPSYELFPGSLESGVFFELPLSGVEVKELEESEFGVAGFNVGNKLGDCDEEVSFGLFLNNCSSCSIY